MKLRNKKGFTIVELVIVIGVIGILSAILIPTFVNLTQKAQESALQSDLANSYSMYAAEAADEEFDGVFTSADGAVTKVAFVDRTEVRLYDGVSSYYEFNEEKAKWLKGDQGAFDDLVVEAAATYYDAEGVAIAEATQSKLSTFGKYVVYYAAA